MKSFATIVCLSLFFVSPSSVNARELFDWSSSNVQLLYGDGFKLGEEMRTILSFEHSHGHRFGDSYGFIDIVKPDGLNVSYYGEISPRLSLSDVAGLNLSHGIIKDILISTTFEKGKDQAYQSLYGFALDFTLPGFKYFKSNFYVHDDPRLQGDTWQITLSWNRPFKVWGVASLVEGFADFQGAEGSRVSNQLIVPRLLMDISGTVGLESRQLMIGIEYQYWNNKAGIEGVKESVVQAQIKLIL